MMSIFDKPASSRIGPPHRKVLFAACLLLLFPVTLLAWSPQDQLRQLVSEDVGIYIEASDLKTHLPALRETEWYRRLQQLPLYQQWAESQDYQNLQRGKRELENLLGKSVEEFGRQLFGTAVAISITPQPEGDPVGVLLTVAESPAALEDAISAWNKAEKNNTETLTHSGWEYYRRVPLSKKSSEQKPLYYATLGTTFVLSDEEASIQEILERHGVASQDESATGSLSASPAFQQAFQSLSAQSVLRVYVNPRSWDSSLPREELTPQESRWVIRFWKELQSVALGVRLQDGVVFEAVLQANSTTTKPLWMSYVGTSSTDATFLKGVPANAVLVISGAISLESLGQLVQKQGQGSEQLQTLRQVSRGLLLGLDLFDDVLPNLGPQWGTFLVPHDEPKPGVFPLHGLVALQLPAPEENTNMATIRQALDNGLNTGLNLLAAWYNGRGPKQPAIVRTANREGITHRWVENLGPYRPSYALTSQHLLVSNTPELIDQFLTPDPENRFVDQSFFLQWKQEYLSDDAHFLFADLVSIREYLSRNEEFFVQQAVLSGQGKEDELRNQLRRTQEVMTLFDVAFLTVQTEGQQLRLTAGVVSAPTVPVSE